MSDKLTEKQQELQQKIQQRRAEKYARTLPEFLLMQEDYIEKSEILSNEYTTTDKARKILGLDPKTPPESDIELIEARKASKHTQSPQTAGTLDKLWNER